jgi:hypothetical protein
MHRFRAVLEHRHGGQRQRQKPFISQVPRPCSRAARSPSTDWSAFYVDRHDIAMAGLDSAFNIRSHRGVKIGLGGTGIDHARRFDAAFRDSPRPSDKARLPFREVVSNAMSVANFCERRERGKVTDIFTNLQCQKKEKDRPQNAESRRVLAEDFAFVIASGYHDSGPEIGNFCTSSSFQGMYWAGPLFTSPSGRVEPRLRRWAHSSG